MSVLEIPPADERQGGWGLTFTGKQFWPSDPRPEDVDIHDIAHALAHQCRFAGHSISFYSIAQHSVLVSQACMEEHALIGLLHDATEAYLQDLIRPLKQLLAPIYKPLEKRWAAAIGVAFGLGDALVNLPRDVEVADRIVLCTERRDVMNQAGPEWWTMKAGDIPLPVTIKPWAPAFAELQFLARFGQLQLTGKGRP